MREKIILEAEHLNSKKEMAPYMKEVFALPDYFGGNLDALYDCLTELDEEITVYLTKDNLIEICQSSYAYKILIILSRAADENPNLKILFK